MARGQRRSPIEKTKDELAKVDDAIKNYEAALITMRAKRKELEQEVKEYEIEELIEFMREKNITIGQAKEILHGTFSSTETM